jgi:hypothetical protein
MVDVPCAGCTLCCHRDLVRILPHEDVTKYYVKPHPTMPGTFVLDHKPNGDCIYLGDGGCTRHADKPQMCREMDCRRISAALSFTRARQLSRRGTLRLPVWKRGKELLRSDGA